MAKRSSRALVWGSALIILFVVVSCSALGSGEPVGSVRKADATSKTQEGETPAPEVSSSVAGAYIAYEDYESNLSEYADTSVVLFFNAAWCPTCKKADENIEANLSSIPEDVTIVSVDYDSATELRQRYGVTIQHTFVEVDSEGNELKKWAGSTTVEEIIEEVM